MRESSFAVRLYLRPPEIHMTARLASSMRSTISFGCVATEAWLVGNVIVFLALIRSAMKFSVSGGIKRSLVEIWYQLGFTFHAGGPDFSSKQRSDVGFCVRAHISDSVSSRSLQNVSRNFSGAIQRNPYLSWRMLAAPQAALAAPKDS
jgi:hypothetical protein